ncbi:MAG: hypothetical protein OEY85_07660 [Rhodospirillales bacterium]|nr:hypothetical protein [Rhodospirillales bacterium]
MSKPTFGVRFTTDLPASQLEEWLGRNCKGEWELRIESLADDLTRKTLILMFEDATERSAFKIAFRGHAQSAKPAPQQSPAAPESGQKPSLGQKS